MNEGQARAAVQEIAARLPGPTRLSVHARDAGTGATLLAVGPDVDFYAASLMKLPLLIAVARQVAAGRLTLERRLGVHSGFDSAVPGESFVMDATYDQDPETWGAVGSTVSVGELARRMTAQSSNIATNLLLEEIGLTPVGDVLAAARCSDGTVVRRGIEDAPARVAGLDNRCTAADLTLLLAALRRGDLVGGPMRSWTLDLLAQQVYRDGIPAGLPPGVPVANKTGSVDDLNHDVALIGAGPALGTDPGPDLVPARTLALAVLCTASGSEAEREAALAAVTRVVWELWA